jgi:hypothetical protein
MGDGALRGAALARGPTAREIRSSARAASNGIKQAAPTNDPERRRSIRYARIDARLPARPWEKTIRWVVPGSRLFSRFQVSLAI